ncbi:unnamed protein product, partial [Ectocarpus fasciculatus]
MGSTASVHTRAPRSKEGILALQEEYQKRTIPQEVMVAHYTPSSFPLVPIINKRTCKLVAESWRAIVQQNECDSRGNMTSGITAFYNDFYQRLDILDTSGRFEAVLTRNVDGVSKLEAKGAILVRIVKFLITVEEDNDGMQYRLYQLGRSHSHKGIRPWQYAIFVQTLLLSISARLGTKASHEIMEGWVNMLAFVIRSMLPSAIKNQVVETEINVNVSSD